MRAGDIDIKASSELYGRSPIEVMRQVAVAEAAQREYTTSLRGRFTPPYWNSLGTQRKYLFGFGIPVNLVVEYLDRLFTGRETPGESRFVKAISKYTSIPVSQVMSMSQGQWRIGQRNIIDIMKTAGLLREAMPVEELDRAYITFWQQAIQGEVIIGPGMVRPLLVERVRQMLLDNSDTEKRFIEAVQMVNRELPLSLEESFEYVKNILQASIRYKTANEAADVVRALDSAKRATSRPQDQPSWRPMADPVSMRTYTGDRVYAWEANDEVRQPEPDSILVNRRKFRFEEGQA